MFVSEKYINICICKYIYCDVYCKVTHPATEYTHATIVLRMLFLVARQQSASQATSEAITT
jgi:hypothetical protein